jgi:hypothetical protein
MRPEIIATGCLAKRRQALGVTERRSAVTPVADAV